MDERLGRGGMGEVWRGFDVELNRAVAVKVLLESATSDAFLERFRREATIGAQFQHQGITVVHDVGLHEDRLFTGPVKSVVFSPDGKLLASSGNDATVRVWKLA